jgi:hypothetical protein
MTLALRALFLGRPLREKLLLVGFVLLATLFALSKVSARVAVFVRDARQTSRTLADQRQWLSNRTAIENAARQSVSIFDPARTLNGLQLQAAVVQMATDAGLTNTSTGMGSDVKSGPIAVHTLVFNITRADWDETLKPFYYSLLARAPYIGIEKCQIAAEGGNPKLLDATFTISSVEIVHDAP